MPMHTRSKRYKRRQRARLRRAAAHAAREASKINENRLALRVAKVLRKFKDAPIGTGMDRTGEGPDPDPRLQLGR
jgi:hypothetical protein